MAVALGVNVDWKPTFQVADVAASGSKWVRSILRQSTDLTPVIEECHAHDIKVLGLVVRESFQWQEHPAAAEIAAAVAHYVPLYDGKLDAWQVGNEPDQQGASSWRMPPGVLEQLLRGFRQALPTARIVGPGMASGQPYNYDTSLVDAEAVHPYVDPAQLAVAATASGKPLWVTEFPWSAEMAWKLLGLPFVEVALAFCWSDAMVAGYGIVERDLAGFRVLAETTAEDFNRRRIRELEAQGISVGTIYRVSSGWPAGTELVFTDDGIFVSVPGVLGAYRLADPKNATFP